MAQQAISPNPPTLRKRPDAISPAPMDAPDDSQAWGAFDSSPQPASDAARSPSGGASINAITPSHDPIVAPRSQAEQDLMDTEQKISAFNPKPLGFWKGLASAYIPALTPRLTGDYENNYNLQKAAALQKIVSTQASADWMEGRNPTSIQNTNTKAGSSENVAGIRAGASEDVANIHAGASANTAEKALEGKLANLGPMADVSPELQQTIGLPAKLPLSQLNRAETAMGKTLTVVQGENGPSIVNKFEAGAGVGATPKSLGIGSPRLGGAMQVADPNSPGNTMVTTAGQAIRSGAQGTQSASVQVPKKVQEKYTSGNVGDQLLAIGTAREHMKLFSQLADALDNGNVQIANKIGNEFGVQFGSDKATNQRIAAQAFGGEVGKAFDGAGVVAGERESAQKNMADYLSKGQFKGAIQTVDQLLAGKQKAAKTAYGQGMQGKPNFGGPTSLPAAGNKDPLGIR